MRLNTPADVKTGMVMFTRGGASYVAITDDNGTRTCINLENMCHNTFEIVDGRAVVSRKAKDNGVVDKIIAFKCAPGGNRLSEALKLAINAEPKYEVDVVWTPDMLKVVAPPAPKRVNHLDRLRNL